MNIDHSLHNPGELKLKWLGIDTYHEPVIYMRQDCHICKSEGFEIHKRVKVTLGGINIIATINHIADGLLAEHEASLSVYAWKLLNAKNNDVIHVSHQKPLPSLSYVRSKVYNHELNDHEMTQIIHDITAGNYSDIDITEFITACAGGRLNINEIIRLTKSMISVGKQLSWERGIIVDKHCVGGLPGNRTTLIVVPIVASFGLTMPKTSSRAITSPAGTADTMETLAPVNLDLSLMRRVVESEGGCIVWGGAVDLSPADDILIRVEHAMEIDSEGQLIASVLSKKIAAGSTHILIDMPIGPTVKIRSNDIAHSLSSLFKLACNELGIIVNVIESNGEQPVGRGIGPALEAVDVLAVLQNHPDAPQDLRYRALTLAGHILEFSPHVATGDGLKIAMNILNSGKAWHKFQAICEAQGGLREPPKAAYQHTIYAGLGGKVAQIDNRNLSRIAKLAGAPRDKAAGITIHVRIGDLIQERQPLYTIHSESNGALQYALSFINSVPSIFKLKV